MEAIDENWDSFIRECHAVYKKAQTILTRTMLELETEIEDLSRIDSKGEGLKKHLYWLRVLESCYEAFLWVAMHSDVREVYKGPKYGRLSAQNIQSVLGVATQMNQDPYTFAVPLDFTRFSCIADLLKVEFDKDSKGKAVDFIEVKQGSVNEAMLGAAKSRSPEAWKAFLDEHGEKGFEQAERFFRAGKEFFERSQQIHAKPGVYKAGKRVRIVAESKATPGYFTGEVEKLCGLARQGDYAVEIVDGCLLVGALDTTSQNRYLLGEFDARLLALNCFLTSEDTSKWQPDHLVSELKKIEFTNWIEGFGSIGLIPLLLRDLSTRTFLDLILGRLYLHCYFHAPNFLQLCRDVGLKAGFFSKKHTNRLRSKQQWRSHDYPTWEGRALGYMVGSHPMVVGSLRLHEIIFNWRKPSSVAEEMASSVSNFDQASIAELKNLTEEDLETS
jgi:hypothetical protein